MWIERDLFRPLFLWLHRRLRLRSNGWLPPLPRAGPDRLVSPLRRRQILYLYFSLQLIGRRLLLIQKRIFLSQ